MRWVSVNPWINRSFWWGDPKSEREHGNSIFKHFVNGKDFGTTGTLLCLPDASFRDESPLGSPSGPRYTPEQFTGQGSGWLSLGHPRTLVGKVVEGSPDVRTRFDSRCLDEFRLFRLPDEVQTPGRINYSWQWSYQTDLESEGKGMGSPRR